MQHYDLGRSRLNVPRIVSRKPPLPIKNRTNEELAGRFAEWLIAQRFARVTQGAYKRVVFRFCSFMGRRSVSVANHLDVRYFLIEVMKRDLSVDGFNRHLWALRRFFDFLYMGGVVDSIAPRFVLGKRRGRPMPRVLGESEIDSLIRAARTHRSRATLELLYSTGCRIGELVRIRVEDMDMKRRSIRVTGKGNRERTVFFGKRAAGAVRTYLKGRKSGPLFLPMLRLQHGCVNWNGRAWALAYTDYSRGRERAFKTSVHLSGKKLTYEQACRIAKKRTPYKRLIRRPEQRHVTTAALARDIELAAHRAKRGRITAHMIRHSFATHLLNRGASIQHIQGLLGHTSLQTTEIYTRAAPTELARAHKRFHPRG